MAFDLDARLSTDSVRVAELPLCHVGLMKDARFVWLILVPKKEGAVELIDLSPADQIVLMEEIAQASGVLKKLFAPHKLNVAALGNMVSQLHVHVIARQQDDAAWPQPVWSVGQPEPYDEAALLERVEKLKHAFGSC